MLGKCYQYALETLFDLHAGQSTSSITCDASWGGPVFDQTALPSVAVAQLGDNPCLVHGPVLGDFGDLKDKKFEHAWIEGNGHVLDCGSVEKDFILVAREDYYAYWRINPGECRRYTIQEATRNVVITGRDFNWTDDGAKSLRGKAC